MEDEFYDIIYGILTDRGVNDEFCKDLTNLGMLKIQILLNLLLVGVDNVTGIRPELREKKFFRLREFDFRRLAGIFFLSHSNF